ncbi:MAG TPA: class I SAM-dependent methyltransferase [Acetobacteraceae bacterium]|nr:class I SAM-dependent methyltransferase [Acetobacteraceae bacterium]
MLHMQEAADRIIDHYERHARAWDSDRRMAAWNDKPWHDRFGALLRRAASVLDLGCGSGSPVAQHLVERGFRVTGVDSSPTLISLCRQRLPDQQWLVEDMRSLRLARRFDGVLAWDSLFHLRPDDQRRMFDVFARHAAASAVLMFNGGPGHREAVGAYRGDPLYHASLSPDEYQVLLSGIGFAVIAHVVEDWQTGGGRTVWLAQADQARLPLERREIQSQSQNVVGTR